MPEDLHSIHIQAPLINFTCTASASTSSTSGVLQGRRESLARVPRACGYPRSAMNAKELQQLLAVTPELALLDVREQGVHHRGHPFFACSAPLSRLELMIADLVPRRGVRVVLLDGAGEVLPRRPRRG